MSQKYPGGIINKIAPVTVGPVDGEGGSAPGIWTLDQALALQKQGLWPKPVLPRELYSWGGNGYGQLGLNDTANRSSPVQIGSLTEWATDSVGSNMGSAIKTNGQLWTWGRNLHGSLGQNSNHDTVMLSSPVQVGALTNWMSVSIGDNFNCIAVKKDGTLWAWGNNNDGQLGLNDTDSRSSPVQIGALTCWFKASTGNGFCAAIKTNGTLWSWGKNNHGQLGINNTDYRSSPVQIGALTNWAKVFAGGYACAAIKTDGTLWAWGNNNVGQLGLNDTISRSSPVQVGSLTSWAMASINNTNCAAIKTDGTLWLWGANNFGQLGNNDMLITDQSSPVQVGALTNWGNVSAGTNSCVAVKTDRTMWSWGRGLNGQLGQNDTISRSSPVQVGALTTWLRVSSRGSSVLSSKTT